jgi:hypothetical protein
MFCLLEISRITIFQFLFPQISPFLENRAAPQVKMAVKKNIQGDEHFGKYTIGRFYPNSD